MSKILACSGVILGLAVLAACGGSKTSPTGASADPMPVNMNIMVMSSAGEQLGSFSMTGNTATSLSLNLAELTARGVRTSGMDDKFMVMRGANQGDRIGKFIANTFGSKLLWRPSPEETSLVIWLFPTRNFPFINSRGHAVTYDCAYSKSKMNFGRGLMRRYGVSVGKFSPGTLIWSGRWIGPGFDLGIVNIMAYQGPDYPIVEALNLLNRFLNIGPVKLGSFVWAGTPDGGDMTAGYGYDYEKQPGFEGLHDRDGKWFIARHAPTIERDAPWMWVELYIEGLEAWTKADDVCGDESEDTIVLPYVAQPHAGGGWTNAGIDLLRFSALMPPVD